MGDTNYLLNGMILQVVGTWILGYPVFVLGGTMSGRQGFDVFSRSFQCGAEGWTPRILKSSQGEYVGIPSAYHPKTNSKFAPENQWLEDETSFWGLLGLFSWANCSFQGGYMQQKFFELYVCETYIKIESKAIPIRIGLRLPITRVGFDWCIPFLGMYKQILVHLPVSFRLPKKRREIRNLI